MITTARTHGCSRLAGLRLETDGAVLTEFGYWIITSGWNIQREWGPFDTATGEPHAEWKLVDRAAMERELPSALALLARTADRVLVPPTSDAPSPSCWAWLTFRCLVV